MSFSDDDEVQVVVQWDAHLKLSPVYEPAFDIFNGKVHKSPPIDTKRTMLLNIVSRRLEEYFLRGTSQATDFEKLKKQCHAGWTSALGRNRVWTMPYTAEKLGLLLVLREQVNSEKKVRACSPRKGRASATNDLKRAFAKLYAAYGKSLQSYLETKRAEANRSVRLPSLDRQLTGTLLQYKFPWNQRKKDANGCPCCQHTSTMAVESNADVNAKNRELRTKASANGGDGKFTAASASHGCYCYSNNCRGHRAGFGCSECMRKYSDDGETPIDRGPGVCGFDCVICACDCKCVFQEHNRQKIAVGIAREKTRLEGQGKAAKKSGRSDPSPEETGRSAWTQLILTEIQNHNVQEHQHIDARSSHELLQDVSTLAAIDAFSNPGMAADTNVSRGLRTLVPLSGPVNYRADDGSKRAMTLAAAKAMERQRGEVRSVSVVSASYTPPPIDFLVNSNTSNRMHRNGLSAAMMPGSSATAARPPLAAAPAPDVTMVKRVMKRAGDTFFGGAASPATKAAAGKVRAQLSRADAAYTSIVDDYEAEKNSQEIFKYCLEQSTLE